MDNKIILGEIFEAVGRQLKDTKSELYNNVFLSNEQMLACLRLLKVASSPQTHIYHIGDLSMRYGVTDRTIRNWIRDGIIPRGKKPDYGETRDFWLSHELYKIDEDLVRRGYVKRKQIEVVSKRLQRIMKKYVFERPGA